MVGRWWGGKGRGITRSGGEERGRLGVVMISTSVYRVRQCRTD